MRNNKSVYLYSISAKKLTARGRSVKLSAIFREASVSQLIQAKSQLLQLIARPEHRFAETLAFIDRYFFYTPSAFRNGDLHSAASENQGSCKILALAKLWQLSVPEVLLCFGEHYRALKQEPEGHSHPNLRRIERDGLAQIEFEIFPLTAKDTD